ncbi:pilus assembly protein [Kitasatospora purpeofusca]|uniref:TadE/TadG family type IV pilus assembly protein n=1 Tax=Kitasatospora purpeofusca TaxID=67352 RepID=UPI002E13B6CB|nr:pilus assembly protein [Kitasatospora purpeofusca]
MRWGWRSARPARSADDADRAGQSASGPGPGRGSGGGAEEPSERRSRRPGGWPRGFAARRAARWHRGRDGGSVAIEAAIVAPAVVALILVAVAAGRVQTAGGTVEAAARSAARAASLARGKADMDAAAEAAAADSMRQQGVNCRKSKVTVGHKKRTSQGVDWDTVEVTVTCEVYLGDLLGGPEVLPKTLTGWFVSVVDRYRGP